MAERRPTTGKRAAPRKPADPEARIVDAAIALAEEVGWDAVRLRQVAKRLKMPLAEVLAHYRDLDAVADAWFGRAWAAMLAPPPRGFAALPARERIHLVMTRWFDALAAHRRVTGQMLSAKLYPSHPHHWVPLVFNLSRTILWLREAALLDATGRRRQIEEVGLTVLFLATLTDWLGDGSEGQERTRDMLRRRLAAADRLMVRVWGARAPPGAHPVS
ncbi:MAG: hypothetical protein ACE5KF_01605 [Kiloniellaceae bacterium]